MRDSLCPDIPPVATSRGNDEMADIIIARKDGSKHTVLVDDADYADTNNEARHPVP